MAAAGAPAARCLTILLTVTMLLGHPGQALGLKRSWTLSLLANQLALLQLMQDVSYAASVVPAAGLEVEGARLKRESHVTLVLDWAMTWGSWGRREFCPKGTFAYAFQIKVEPPIDGDDTSMNGIELFCADPASVGRDGHPPSTWMKDYSIKSDEQVWGYWRGKKYCPKGFLSGMKMRSEPSQGGDGDDTAANDLEMQCDHSSVILNGGGNSWGHYSSWATCPKGWAICGLQTRIEPRIKGDDTALNDVRMFCCDTNVIG